MPLRPRLAVAPLAALLLAGCGESKPDGNPPFKVVVLTAAPQSYESEIALTGAVRARVQTELSFRVSGRVIERRGEVGQHVEAGAVLAKLDPSEQQADFVAAQAGVVGAEATMRQAQAAFDRQKALLASGYTTKAAYDQADQARRSAAGSLDAARAQLGSAQDALSYTELRASRAGVITARNIEVGQVAQAAQSAFGFAEDGPRDAVFALYESIFSHSYSGKGEIDLSLLNDPRIAAQGKVREISPVVDERTGTVQVKVDILTNTAAMPLGAAVTGRAHWRLDDVVVLPWTALTVKDGKPAVWIVDAKSGAVHLRPVDTALYEKEKVVLRDGFHDAEKVVVEGGKFLRENQIVSVIEGSAS